MFSQHPQTNVGCHWRLVRQCSVQQLNQQYATRSNDSVTYQHQPQTSVLPIPNNHPSPRARRRRQMASHKRAETRELFAQPPAEPIENAARSVPAHLDQPEIRQPEHQEEQHPDPHQRHAHKPPKRERQREPDEEREPQPEQRRRRVIDKPRIGRSLTGLLRRPRRRPSRIPAVARAGCTIRERVRQPTRQRRPARPTRRRTATTRKPTHSRPPRPPRSPRSPNPTIDNPNPAIPLRNAHRCLPRLPRRRRVTHQHQPAHRNQHRQHHQPHLPSRHLPDLRTQITTRATGTGGTPITRRSIMIHRPASTHISTLLTLHTPFFARKAGGVVGSSHELR